MSSEFTIEQRVEKLEADVELLKHPTVPPVTKPTEGVILHGGWGASQDPNTWKVVSMKKPKDQFKVVDSASKNVITNFTTKAIAQQYIDWAKSVYVPPVVHSCPAGQHWSDVEQKCVDDTVEPPPPAGQKDQFGILKIAPDRAGGQFITAFEKEDKERNYSSGKPSEWSIESTAEAPFGELESTYYCKINGFKTNEPDTVSTKILGGSHTDGQGHWYITELSTDGTPDKNFETEKPHPENHPNHQNTNFTIGESIIGRWVGYKTITYLINGGKDRRIEYWLDYPVADINSPPNNWRMYWGVDDTGQLDNGHIIERNGDFVTCRIDGVEKNSLPDFKYESVREIVARTTPPPPPPPPLHVCPSGQHWSEAEQKCVDDVVNPPPPPPSGGGLDKFGVKLLSSDGKNIDYEFTENFRDDGKRFDFEGPKTIPMVNCELTGYFADHDGIDDEVSGKQRGGSHSDGSVPKVYDMGVDIKTGACRYRTEEKHPEYEDGNVPNTIGDGKGVPLKDKYVGYKFVCNAVDSNSAINLQIWQDAGNNEGASPSNQWVQIANWVVKDPLWLTVADDHQETIRIDDDNGCPNLSWKWLSCAEIKA